MKKKDYVADIMDKWYKAMEKENVQVQPKCATMLGTILSEYKIELVPSIRDIWAEAMTIKGGDFPKWYDSLNTREKGDYETGRQKASELHDPRNQKTLLKG